ncbi:MAG: hypothetical protein R3351_05680 [Nitrospirales bacterium]|nr:hypothetical protein [Nitrospirales bacterium]
MNRIIVLGCVSVFLSIGAILGLTAQADESKKELSASAASAEESFCKELASEYPVSQDTCVVCVNAGDSGEQCLCESISENDMRHDGRLENHAECVKTFKHILQSRKFKD